jgi:hypothetical protein
MFTDRTAPHNSNNEKSEAGKETSYGMNYNAAD